MSLFLNISDGYFHCVVFFETLFVEAVYSGIEPPYELILLYWNSGQFLRSNLLTYIRFRLFSFCSIILGN